MESHGYGKRLYVFGISPEELVETIEHVLPNQTIKRNGERATAILKDKPESATKRASYWIDHVIKYGSKHLEGGASKLNIFQFYIKDIFLLTFIVLTLFVTLLIIILGGCFKRAIHLFPGQQNVKLS